MVMAHILIKILLRVLVLFCDLWCTDADSTLIQSNVVYISSRKYGRYDLKGHYGCVHNENKIPMNPCFRSRLVRVVNGKVMQTKHKNPKIVKQNIKIPKSFGFHFSVIDNVLYYINPEKKGFGYTCGTFRFVEPSRDRRWLLQLSRILKFMKVPNFEFLFFSNDVPPLQPYPTLPGVSFSKLRNTSIIPFPFLKSEFSENLTLPARDQAFEEVRNFQGTLPFQKKKDMLIWVGRVKQTAKVVSDTSPRLLIKGIMMKYPYHVYVPKEILSFVQQSKFKYILSLPGRGFTWYLTYALLTGSAVFIQENTAVQWYQEEILPYVHFIPVSNDLSNLIDQIEWARMNQQKTMQIAEAGRKFALEHFSPDSIEQAAKDSILKIAKEYESKFEVSALPRKSFIKACAMSVAVCGSRSTCKKCSNCRTYDY